jgi:hypothetical protein
MSKNLGTVQLLGRLKGKSHEKVCEIMNRSKLRFANSFLKFKIGRLKAMIFQTEGLSM